MTVLFDDCVDGGDYNCDCHECGVDMVVNLDDQYRNAHM